MWCKSQVLLAAEFKQKKPLSWCYPMMHYGAMWLPWGCWRQISFKGITWVTRDSNRLTNFAHRYSAVLADLDTKRNEEELHVSLENIRWNDHRRLYWRCSFCGRLYRKSVSVRTKYHAGCNSCKKQFASEVLQMQITHVALAETHPSLVKELAMDDKNDNIATLPETSKFDATWVCKKCGKSYNATIRSRTGKVESGQCPLHPDSSVWTSYCPECSWAVNYNNIAKQTLRDGQYLGLEHSLEEIAHISTQAMEKLPRRKRMVV